MKLKIIGAGMMATAIAGGIVRAKVFKAAELAAFDVLPAAAEAFSKNTGVRCESKEIVSLAREAEAVLLAVKPQTLVDAAAPLAKVLTEKPVISIVAGVPIARIEA